VADFDEFVRRGLVAPERVAALKTALGLATAPEPASQSEGSN
jgi:hypothetical protein